jgi:hypothetical protein
MKGALKEQYVCKSECFVIVELIDPIGGYMHDQSQPMPRGNQHLG